MPLFFTDECWPIFIEGLKQLFVELDPVGCVRKLDYYLPCALDAVSRAASLCIVAGAALLKVPQILNVLKAKSADGLSLLSLELDVLVFIASIAYSVKLSYSLHSYGEQVLVLIQNVILCLLAYGFEKRGTRGVMSAALGAGAVALCAATPLAYAWVLSSVSLVANIGSLVPQILKNRRRQETGALSAATVRMRVEIEFRDATPARWRISTQVQMRLLGNAARLFTTAVESADAVLLLGYGASFTLNGMLAWQIRAYAPRKED